jgi:hypothetical protein
MLLQYMAYVVKRLDSSVGEYCMLKSGPIEMLTEKCHVLCVGHATEDMGYMLAG